MRMNYGTSVKAGVLAKPKLQGVAAAALSFIMMLALAGCQIQEDEGPGPDIDVGLRGSYTITGGFNVDGKTLTNGQIISFTYTELKGPDGETILSGLHSEYGGIDDKPDFNLDPEYWYLYAGTEKIGVFVTDFYQVRDYVFLGRGITNQGLNDTYTSGILTTYKGKTISAVAREGED
jgi:hypothetical protein